ncbi:MAG: hypothetical protein GY807_07475 [Gammaproteobacteria bacterium]|nr:hypothetical protein [Gammaproteobacteria bacterium]
MQARAFTLLGRPNLSQIAHHIANNIKLDETDLQWSYLDRKSQEFKRRLRRVVRTVSFTMASANDPLLEALAFLKLVFQEGKALWHYPIDEISVLSPRRCAAIFAQST